MITTGQLTGRLEREVGSGAQQLPRPRGLPAQGAGAPYHQGGFQVRQEAHRTGIGLGVFLIVIGAILSFTRLDNDLLKINLDVVGYILMAGGVLALVFGTIQNRQRANTSHRSVVERRTIEEGTVQHEVRDVEDDRTPTFKGPVRRKPWSTAVAIAEVDNRRTRSGRMRRDDALGDRLAVLVSRLARVDRLGRLRPLRVDLLSIRFDMNRRDWAPNPCELQGCVLCERTPVRPPDPAKTTPQARWDRAPFIVAG